MTMSAGVKEWACLEYSAECTAFLGKPVMSMGQLIRLQTGDVVPIQVNEVLSCRLRIIRFSLLILARFQGQAVSLTKRI